MQSKGWEEIYKKYREVQSDILKKVKEATIIFKKNKLKKILDLGC